MTGVSFLRSTAVAQRIDYCFFLFINKWPGKSYLKFDISRGIYYVICWSSTLRMKWRQHWKVKQNKKPIKPHRHVSFAVRDEFLEIPRGYNLSARMWHADASWNFSKKAYCVSKPLFNIIGFNVRNTARFLERKCDFFFHNWGATTSIQCWTRLNEGIPVFRTYLY